MPNDTTVVDDTNKGAADVAAPAASGTEADKAIAEKAAADALEAAKTPEQKAAEAKAAVEKQIADAVAAEAAKYKAPEKYEGLKLPDTITVDPTLVERTAATLRELGLSQDKAQKALDFVASEAARERDAAIAAYAPPTAENPDGGVKWKEQDTAWRAAALVDKDLGNGKPEQLASRVKVAQQFLAKYGDEESIGFIDSALGSNPAVLRLLYRAGAAAGEQGLVKGTENIKPGEKPLSEIFYPKGAARTAEEIAKDGQ